MFSGHAEASCYVSDSALASSFEQPNGLTLERFWVFLSL